MTTAKTGSIGWTVATAVLTSAFALGCAGDDNDTTGDGAAEEADAGSTGGPADGGAAGSAHSLGGSAQSRRSERSAAGAAGAGGEVSSAGADAGAGGAGTGAGHERGGAGGTATVGAAGATGNGPEALPLDVMGVWTDDYGGYHHITEAVWIQSGFGEPSKFNITAYDNNAKVVIAHNDAKNAYNPKQWSRFDWTDFDGSVWYCTTAYDAATEQDAADAARPDSTDPSSGGCGSFAWTQLIPPAIVGTYSDAWGGTHEVDPYRWIMGRGDSASVYVFAQFDNDAMYAIAQNDEANAHAPGLWSRFDWTEYENDLYYCSTAYDAASEQDALDTPRADDTDPTSGGCGDFAWSQLIER